MDDAFPAGVRTSWLSGRLAALVGSWLDRMLSSGHGGEACEVCATELITEVDRWNGKCPDCVQADQW